MPRGGVPRRRVFERAVSQLGEGQEPGLPETMKGSAPAPLNLWPSLRRQIGFVGLVG
jgi:hypothetical protein